MIPSIEIRPGADELVEQMVECRRGDPMPGPTIERLRAYLRGTHHPQHALPPRTIFVAMREGSIVGYIAGHETNRFGKEGELQYLYVQPEHRGGEVAGRLVKALAKWFVQHKLHSVCVNVAPENERARGFYRRMGAQELNEHWMSWEDIGVVATA